MADVLSLRSFRHIHSGGIRMRIPTFIEKLPSGLIVAIQWNCGCAWDVDVGQVICEMHQEDPEA